MGIEGRNYREILAFYFPGTSVSIAAAGIPWQRLSSDRIALLTANPSHDGAILALAERQLLAVSRRTGWVPPGGIEILVYPDLDTFRDATGEPGWVAAYSTGPRIHLQPALVLESHGVLETTLRHELLHVLVESQAAPQLPLWFREGLVEFLASPPAATGAARIPIRSLPNCATPPIPPAHAKPIKPRPALWLTSPPATARRPCSAG